MGCFYYRDVSKSLLYRVSFIGVPLLGMSILRRYYIRGFSVLLWCLLWWMFIERYVYLSVSIKRVTILGDVYYRECIL